MLMRYLRPRIDWGKTLTVAVLLAFIALVAVAGFALYAAP